MYYVRQQKAAGFLEDFLRDGHPTGGLAMIDDTTICRRRDI
jgi:hypothetical protein